MELRRVGIEAADIDGLLLIGPLDVLDTPRACGVDEQRRELPVTDRVCAADVVDAAVALVTDASAEKRIDHVIDMHEVAQLRPVAVDLNGSSLEGQANEPADESLPIVSNQLTRPVHVPQPKGAGADAEHVVVDQVILLARRFVDAVHIRRSHQMRFVHGKRVGPTVDLPRAGEDDFRVRVVMTASLEQRQLASTVDVEIGVRISHAVDVAHLTREVEHDGLLQHERVHGIAIANVSVTHPQPVCDVSDVERIAAVVRQERIDQQHVGTQRDEATCEIAADEAEASGHHHAATAIELVRIRRHGCRVQPCGSMRGSK